MSKELFCIKQQQIIDIWGNFAVVDSYTNADVGYLRRKGLKSSFARDEWEIYDDAQRPVGRIYESSLARALARKYLPYVGALIPEKVILELDGRPVAEINQSFKIVGDIWEIDCQNIPPDFDRRVLLSCILLMGIIERRHD